MLRAGIGCACVSVLLSVSVERAEALDREQRHRAQEMTARAIEYLRTQQDEETGGWSVPPEGAPALPAITALVVRGMLMDPKIDADDPAVARGVEYLLSFRKPDGSIHGGVLATYNTAIALSALADVRRPEASAAIVPAQNFLKGIQWSEDSLDHPETGKVERDHAFYGGIGYGRHGRPDLSNTAFAVEAWRASGLSTDDEAFQRALVFLQRVQMHGEFNDMEYAGGSTQGGFIYSTSINADEVGVGQSFAGTIEEVTFGGQRVSRLRAYGSMTYAGFKSYLYADLDRDDPRVRMAHEWIAKNYTLAENPGMGMDGFYYYLLMFSRAMDAWGDSTITVLTPEGEPMETREWASDLVERLSMLQREDGSFASMDDRWMEDNPVLITAYSLLALQHALR